MEVTTLIVPFPKGQKKPSLATPVDALSFLQHQQAERTMTRHYKVTLKEAHPVVSGLFQFKLQMAFEETLRLRSSRERFNALVVSFMKSKLGIANMQPLFH